MSRVAKNPIAVPSGVQIDIKGQQVNVKGTKGSLDFNLHPLVAINESDNVLTFEAKGNSKQANAISGTTRAVIYNMVVGVSEGYQRKLNLVGVGYRAVAKGKTLVLTVGFSHPVEMDMPEGITVETPTQTEIVLSGIDKQKIGQIAANIRAVRPPEPYKGKGILYANEVIIRKESKKK